LYLLFVFCNIFKRDSYILIAMRVYRKRSDGSICGWTFSLQQPYLVQAEYARGAARIN